MKKLCLLMTFCMVLFTSTQAQQKSSYLKGIVTNEGGRYLENVEIAVSNQRGQVVERGNSDSLGMFQITGLTVDSNYSVRFSMVGYQVKVVQNVLIKENGSSILAQMAVQDSSEGLNKIVVVGYGTQRKITLTGAQSTVDVKDINYPVANLNSMLAGRVAGLVGVQRSGLPGSNDADIWIRGISTFGASNDSRPLVIIDGVKGRSMNDFDPEDIQSFTILKDASATAVYGAEGANGVIIIKTKRGSIGKVKMMVNFQEGVSMFTKTPKMASAKTFMELSNEASLATGLTPMYTQQYMDSTLSPLANHYVFPNVDWMDLLFNDISDNRRVNFSASGGTEKFRFYTALAYYDENSLLKTQSLKAYDAGTRYRRYNFVSNIDMNWTKTTKFHLGLSGFLSDHNQPGAGASAAFSEAMQVSPVYYPAMYPGNLVAGVTRGSSPSPNPWADITQNGYIHNFRAKLASTLGVDQDLGFWVPGLTLKGQFSFDANSTNELKQTRTRSVYYLNQVNPYREDGSLNLDQVYVGNDALSYNHSTGQGRNFSLQGQIAYQKQIQDHRISAMLVYNQLSIPNPDANSYTSAIPTRTQNYATRFTYSYKDKYLFEFDGGYTGSQVFAPSNRYAFFPAFSGGWVLSNENFWEALSPVVQFFKIRYSNGFSGAIGGTRFDYLTTITTNANGVTLGKPGATTSYNGVNIGHYGADVRWAKSHDQDLGLEFNIINNKLSFVVDWFRKYRTGVFLTRANFPLYAGLQYNPDGNFGITINKGVDGTVQLSPMKLGRDVNISLRGTFSYYKNKLLDNSAAPYTQPYMDPRGQAVSTSIQGYIAEGLFQSEAEIATSPDQSGVGGAQPRVGDIKYKDLNGDGQVNFYDKTTISQGNVPSWTFGAGFNINFKRFYLSAFFQGVQGADRLLSGVARAPFASGNGIYNNLYALATDRWTPESKAQHPFYPRLALGTSANTNNNVPSTWWVKDISFIRFKTLDLGYNLPEKAFTHLGVSSARVYFSGINLFYWSPFKMWDPEIGTGSGDVYPNTRLFSLGLQIHFN